MQCQCGDRGKYKCPKCFQRYCSAGCFNVHKTACAPVESLKKNPPVVRHPPRNFLMEDEDENVLKDEELDQMSIF
jgi:HIT zinc finger